MGSFDCIKAAEQWVNVVSYNVTIIEILDELELQLGFKENFRPDTA